MERRTSLNPATVERRLRIADDLSAAARARQLVAYFRGERQRVDDARLLLSEMVVAAQYQGVEFVDVRLTAFSGCLRLEVRGPHRRAASRARLQLPPAGEMGRVLIERLSDHSSDDGLTAWCELYGQWAAADVPVYVPGAAQRSA